MVIIILCFLFSFRFRNLHPKYLLANPTHFPVQNISELRCKYSFLPAVLFSFLPLLDLENGVKKAEFNTWMEFVLHGMAAYSLLSKFQLEEGNKFSDITSAMFNYGEEDVDDDLKELFK